MKSKLFSIVTVVLLCAVLAVSAFAFSTVAEEPHFIDNAGLLTESESASLEATLEAVGAKHSLEIAIYTTASLGDKTATEYADDVFDSMYGDVDGVLLLISMEYGDWQISTCGKGITIFTDAGIDYIGEKVVAYLANDDFKNAFDEFAQLCDDFAVQAESGEPYDSSNLPREPLSALWIVIALVVGFLLALMVVGNMKSKLKTVRSQDGAASYIRDGSMNITNSRDLYLYRTVTRTKKAEENSNSSSGSSTHTSSSGTTHGGGGGKF